MERKKQKNVLGEDLKTCGCDPMTGWLRDGTCYTDFSDQGIHSVCGVVTEDYLEFAKLRGNDLMTPNLNFGFPGLKEGDSWCLCAWSWFDAYKHGHACPVKLEATNEETLAIIPIDALQDHAYKSEES